MPTDNKKAADKSAVTSNAETTVQAIDPRIAELEAEVRDLRQQLESSRADVKMLRDKKQKEVQVQAPVPMTAVLADGRTVKVLRTVIAKFALDEVKKGFIEEDLELLVTERG